MSHSCAYRFRLSRGRALAASSDVLWARHAISVGDGSGIAWERFCCSPIHPKQEEQLEAGLASELSDAPTPPLTRENWSTEIHLQVAPLRLSKPNVHLLSCASTFVSYLDLSSPRRGVLFYSCKLCVRTRRFVCSRRFEDRASRTPYEDLDPHRDYAGSYRLRPGSFVATKIWTLPSDRPTRKNSQGDKASEIDPVDGTRLHRIRTRTVVFETIVRGLDEVGRRNENLCASRIQTMQATTTRFDFMNDHLLRSNDTRRCRLPLPLSWLQRPCMVKKERSNERCRWLCVSSILAALFVLCMGVVDEMFVRMLPSTTSQVPRGGGFPEMDRRFPQ